MKVIVNISDLHVDVKEQEHLGICFRHVKFCLYVNVMFSVTGQIISWLSMDFFL